MKVIGQKRKGINQHRFARVLGDAMALAEAADGEAWNMPYEMYELFKVFIMGKRKFWFNRYNNPWLRNNCWDDALDAGFEAVARIVNEVIAGEWEANDPALIGTICKSIGFRIRDFIEEALAGSAKRGNQKAAKDWDDEHECNHVADEHLGLVPKLRVALGEHDVEEDSDVHVSIWEVFRDRCNPEQRRYYDSLVSVVARHGDESDPTKHFGKAAKQLGMTKKEFCVNHAELFADFDWEGVLAERDEIRGKPPRIRY